MSEKTLKFDNIWVNKKEFHKSKQPINLDLVIVDQIVVPLCIILLHLTGYIKYFENGGRKHVFCNKNDDVLDKYNEIWDKIN